MVLTIQKLGASLEPKFKWNWAEVDMINEMKERLKVRLTESNRQHTQVIVNNDNINFIIDDDF